MKLVYWGRWDNGGHPWAPYGPWREIYNSRAGAAQECFVYPRGDLVDLDSPELGSDTIASCAIVWLCYLFACLRRRYFEQG